MALNKFQRSRLTFALSAKVAHTVVQSIYYILVFSQNIGPIELKFHVKTPYDKIAIGPIELKFHVKTPYDKIAKFYSKHIGHMAKMAATPIYGKNHLKIFFSRSRRPMILGLGM